MADRTYLIEVLLKARDDSAAAFAKFESEVAAVNKQLDEQRLKTAATSTEFQKHQKVLKDLGVDYEQDKKKAQDIITSYTNLEKSVKNLNTAQASRTKESQSIRKEVEAANEAERNYALTLTNVTGKTKEGISAASLKATQTRQYIQLEQSMERAYAGQSQAIEKVISANQRHIETIARGNASFNQQVTAVRALSAAHDELVRKGINSEVVTKSLSDAVQRSTRDWEQAARAVREHADSLAADAARGTGGPRGPVGGITAAATGGFDQFIQKVNQAAQTLTSFGATWGQVLGAAVIQPAAALILGLVGAFASLATTVGAAASALGVTFLSAMTQSIPVMGLFAYAMQGLQQAMQIVQGRTQQQQQAWLAQYQTAQQIKIGINQVAIAQHNYSNALFAAQQASLNIIASQHQYSDALFAQRQAINNVSVAELGLRSARQQATRQLQDLIFQETQARLASMASSLAIGDAQKALQAAIATGGDVRQAQLNLAQATASHQQSVVQTQRAITDAAPGSVARQQIGETVKQAQLGVTQAQHAVVDANFAVTQAQQGIVAARRALVDAQFQITQARAAIIQAQQAAHGYNLAAAAQQAYLLATTSRTVQALANNIQKIRDLFISLPGQIARFRPLQDAILRPFVVLTGEIYKLLTDPRVFGALRGLANTIGSTLTRVFRAIFSSPVINNFIQIIKDATNNIGPLGNIVIAIFKTIQAVVIAAGPALTKFLEWIGKGLTSFAAWANSAKGQNTLKKWFDEAFIALEKFLSLGVALARFIAALGRGGGIRTGIDLITELTTKLNRMTAELNNKHGPAWKNWQAILATVRPVLHDLSIIFGALGTALLQLGTTRQGRQALDAIAQFFSQVIIPGITQAIIWFGKFADAILALGRSHPVLFRVARDITAIGVAAWLLMRPLRAIWGMFETLNKWVITPILTKLGLIKKAEEEAAAAGGAGGLRGALSRVPLVGRLAGRGAAAGAAETGAVAGFGVVGGGAAAEAGGAAATTAGLGSIGAVAAPLAAVVAGLALAAKLTGNLGNAFNALKAPFISFWDAIRGPLRDLRNQFSYLISGIESFVSWIPKAIGWIGNLGNSVSRASGPLQWLYKFLHDDFAVAFRIFGDIFGGVGRIIGDFFGSIAKQFAGIFEIIGGILHGNMGKVWDGFKKLAVGAFDAFWLPLKDLGKLLWNLIWDAVRGALTLGKDFFNLGWTLIQALGKGIASLASDVGKWIYDNILRSVGHFFSNLWNIGWNTGTTIIHAIGSGIASVAKDVGKWIYDNILKSIGNFFSNIWNAAWNLGRDIVNGIAKGISSLPHIIIHAIGSIIPGPIKDVLKTAGGLIGSFASALGIHIGRRGGPVPGSGKGDIVPAMLEPGEHVLTRTEVQAAGGHEAIFAFRRSLGGGGQGGPFGYQAGGRATGGAAVAPQTQALSAQANTVFGVLGIQSARGQVVEGVTGLFGSTLANINLFAKRFIDAWNYLWATLNKITKDQFTTLERTWDDSFKTINGLVSSFNTIVTNEIRNFWNNINKFIQTQLGTFTTNFKTAYKKFADDTFNAFWYIDRAAQQALTGFGVKWTAPALVRQPGFAAGGFVGQAGERGRDLVHAMLGRGEAVLNYAQQKMIEPALRAFYGFGLDKLFKSTKAQHAGSGQEPPRSHKLFPERGYATGGYVFPFPRGQPFSWARIDQGQDLQTRPGGVVVAIAPGIVSQASDRFAGFGPFYPTEQITSGPLAGHGVYYGHTRITRTGKVNPGDVIAVTQPRANDWTLAPAGWLELGFLPYGSMTAGNAIAPILRQLAAGHRVTAVGGLGGVTGPAWSAIKTPIIKGTGVLADALRAAARKVVDAANAFGASKAGGLLGGVGQIGTNWKGPWVSVMSQIAASRHWNLADWKWLVNAESSGNPAAVNPTSGAFGLGQFLGSTAQQYAKYGALSHDPVKQIEAMAQYILDRYGTPTAAKAFHITHNSYAEGGVVGGDEGKPVGIVAHVGEWVLNRMQQSKVANWIGTSVGGLKDALGFTGGPTQFADGGIVVGGATPGYVPPELQRAGPTITGAIRDILTFRTFLVNIAGQMTQVQVAQLQTPQYLTTAITRYNTAQATIIRRLERNGRNVAAGIGKYLDNWNLISGTGGILDLAQQALSDYINRQSTLVQLAAAGVRVFNNQLRFGRAQTAVQAAFTDLAATQAELTRIEALRSVEVKALAGVNSQIRNFGKITAANVQRYNILMGARQTLINYINTQDQQIAQALADRIQKQQALFTAQTAQALRNLPGTRTTLTGAQVGLVIQSANNLQSIISKVGPSIASGLAQMAQSVAQTLGDPAQLAAADRAIVQSAQETVNILRQRYAAAAQRAATDPRWQTVADDLLQQLESAVTSLAQAQAQALTDAINAQDIKVQIQQSKMQMQQSILQAVASIANAFVPTAVGGAPAVTQYTAIQQQIVLSQANAAQIAQQIAAYQALYTTAQQQGNVTAMNQLTQTINGLNTTMVQANVNTQELITSFYQLSVTLQSTFAQTSTGFIGAAASIFQTIGSIMGNQQLPQLIANAQAAAGAIAQAGQMAVANIQQVLAGAAGPAFPGVQTQANQLLSAAVGAFQQGASAFATWLTQNAAALAQFEMGLPSQQQQQFQGLIQALVDNTTAQVQNTLQLQQLNATTNQQAFSSTAWQMFRQAIFNGLGGLLPQYSMTIPTLQAGGILTKSGLFYGHSGEAVVPATITPGVPPGHTYQTNHINITNPTEVADPNYIGNAIAWRLGHGVNSR